MSELAKRNISSLVVLAIFVMALMMGRTGLVLLSGAMSFVMVFEYHRAVEAKIQYIGYIALVVLFAYPYLGYGVTSALGMIVVLYLLYYIFFDVRINDVAISAFSTLYVGIPVLTAMLILLNFGLRFFVMTLIIPVATDVFAFVVGKLWGKTKLIPTVSPNKTVEGAIGAIFASALFTALYAYFYLGNYSGSAMLIGAVGSLFAQCGDLVASKIKRETGLKDFGNIIPGHGGVLDRLDSYLLVFPMMYVFFIVVVG